MELNRENMTDRELIERALEQDSEAFEQLFVRYKDEILQRYLQKTGNNHPDANDMLQETFVKVYVNLHRYKPEYTFGQWIHTIARNTFIDYTRKKKDNMLSIDQQEKGVQRINPPSNSPTPEEKMILSQSSKELDQMLEQLPPRYGTMIVMRFVKEYSYEEIAGMLNLPLGTVKTQIHRARERLYKMICNNDGIL